MPTPRLFAPEYRVGRNRSGATITKKLIVKTHAAGGVDGVELAAAATDTLYGVASDTAEHLSNLDVQIRGRAVVTSGAAVAIGDRVTADAAGKCRTAAPAAGVNNGILGIAMTAATGADEDIEVELAGPGAIMQGA